MTRNPKPRGRRIDSNRLPTGRGSLRPALNEGSEGTGQRLSLQRTGRALQALGRAAALLIALSVLGWTAVVMAADEKAHKLATVSLRKMADSLHAVIAADQRTYVAEVLRREQAAGTAVLPGHAEMLRKAAQAIQRRGAEFSYTLRSLQPIAPGNGPQTEVEQTGLEFVATHPGENYYAEEELGGRSYFTAIYAERATLASCIECHNQHPQSPRQDLKLDDVMGAIVVRVPLEF